MVNAKFPYRIVMVSKSCTDTEGTTRYRHHSRQNIRSSIENLRQIKPFKFYTVVKPEIYPRLVRQSMIARFNRDGAERFNTHEAAPVNKIDGV
jgi:hypothetical protein